MTPKHNQNTKKKPLLLLYPSSSWPPSPWRVWDPHIIIWFKDGWTHSPIMFPNSLFPSSEYANKFQAVQVLVYWSFLYWAKRTKSSKAPTFLTLFNHIAIDGGLESFQQRAIPALAALTKLHKTEFLYVCKGICEQWSKKKKAGSSGIGKVVNFWEILCTSNQYCLILGHDQNMWTKVPR